MAQITYKGNRAWKVRMAALVVADVLSIVLSYAMALVLRFDFQLSAIPSEFHRGFLEVVGPWLLITVAVFYICRLYHSIWSRVGSAEMEMIVVTYLVLMPADDDSNEIVILAIQPVDEENENYLAVEDEAVLDAVYAIFKERYKDVLSFAD